MCVEWSNPSRDEKKGGVKLSVNEAILRKPPGKEKKKEK